MKTPYFLTFGFVLLAITAVWFDQRPDIKTQVEASSDGTDFKKEDMLHLIYWEKWNGFEGEAMQACVDRFNQHSKIAFEDSESVDDTYRKRFLSFKGKRIYVHMLSTTKVNQKTLLAVSGGIPPDVAGLWSRDVPDFAQYQAALPLDHWIKRDGPNPEDYYRCYWEMCVYQGKVWALPTAPATVALHWNKDLFEEAGLDPEQPPRTMAELDQFNKKLLKKDKQGKIIRMGFLPTEPGWWNYAWGNWFGGRHASPDGRTITCNSKEWVAAFTWLNNIAETYGRDEMIKFHQGLGTFDTPLNPFISGKVAMVIQGVWMANFIRRYKPSMSWGAAPFPGPGGTPSQPVTLAQADVLMIPKGCRHPEEAWKFVRYVNSRGDPNELTAPVEGIEILCLEQGKHSPFKTTTKNFLRQQRHEQLQVFMDLAGSENAIIEPLMPMWKEYRLALQKAFEKLWLKGGDPKEILDELQKEFQKKLDRTWEKIDS